VFGIIPIAMTYVYGTLLTAAGRLKALNMLAATSLLINVGVNLVCIPRYGAVGSAYASLAAQGFMAVAQIWAALRIFNMQPRLSYILKIVFFALLIVCFSLLTPRWVWWLKAAAALLLALTVALALGLVRVREIVQTLRQPQPADFE